MEVKKRKVEIKDLKLGMYVTELDRPWLETRFMFQGFRIRSDRDVSRLGETCEFVYIDEAKSYLPVEEKGKEVAPQNFEVRPYETTFEDEIHSARDIHHRAQEYTKRMFEDVRLGKNIDVLGTKELVADMVRSILRNPDALLLLSNLKDRDEYLAMHAINVTILALTLGRHLGLSRGRLNELGLGGLLHDVGEMRVPEDILHKEGSLSAEENKIMKAHTDHGLEILTATAGLPLSTREIAHAHHERMNGSGYPRGIVGDEITYLSKIVAIVDVYDAVTSKRVYGRRITSIDALKNMYNWRNELFDADMVEQFIQCLGIYPIGSVVELNSGEVGIVISVEPKSRLLPKLMLVRNSEKRPYFPPKILNLAQYKPEDFRGSYEIKRVLEPDAYGIDLKSYLLRELYLNKVSG